MAQQRISKTRTIATPGELVSYKPPSKKDDVMAESGGMLEFAMVGRDAEVAEVGAFLDGTRVGARALILEGEPGIGKTTLWNAGIGLADRRGIEVLSARPVESVARLAFSVLTDLFERVPEAAFAGLPAPQRRALDAALLRAEPVGQPPDRRAVAVAAFAVLGRQCKSAPILVAIDDLGFVDRSSVQVLQYALRRLERAPIGLLATELSGQSVGSALGHAFGHAFGPGALRRLHIGPLRLETFRAVLDGHRGRPLGRAAVTRLHQASGGNPFVGLELVTAIAARDKDAQPGEPLPVPASLRALVQGRLDALPEHARRTVVYVAAAPEPTVGAMVAACGDQARAALDAAEAARVINVSGHQVRFTHPVLRSVAYSTATASQRRDAHRALAGISAEPEARARHLALAAEGPDQQVAEALDSAALAACLRGAADAAAELADLAVVMTAPHLQAARVRRLTRAGELRFAAGDLAGARRVLAEAVAGSQPGLARAQALYLQAKVERNVTTGPAAVALITQALAEAEGDHPLQARLHRDLGYILVNLGDLAGVKHYQLALEHAEQTGDPALVAQTVGLCAVAEWGAGHPVPWDLVERCLDVMPVSETGTFSEHEAMELRPKVVVSHLLRYNGDLARARSLLLEEYDAVVELGAESDLPMVALWLAELETWAGNWDLAARYADEGYHAALSSAGAGTLALAHGIRSLLRACRGQTADARADAAAAIEGARRCGWNLIALYGAQAEALACLSIGDPAAAHAALETISARMLRAGIAHPAYSRFVPDDVEALVRLGRLDEAGALSAAFHDGALRTGNIWALAVSGRCRALLAGARGEHGLAAAALDDAFAAHGKLDMPFDLARTHLAGAEACRRGRQRLAAGRHAQAALDIFERLGAAVWAERAREEHRRTAPRRAASPGLTAAERRVAGIAAAGRTNREIAAELFMGLRTVEAHLTRAYAKLGVSRRTQLAAALGEQADLSRLRLPPPPGSRRWPRRSPSPSSSRTARHRDRGAGQFRQSSGVSRRRPPRACR
jgi:DNA-binding CsgD family transcriptional regulator